MMDLTINTDVGMFQYGGAMLPINLKIAVSWDTETSKLLFVYH